MCVWELLVIFGSWALAWGLVGAHVVALVGGIVQGDIAPPPEPTGYDPAVVVWVVGQTTAAVVVLWTVDLVVTWFTTYYNQDLTPLAGWRDKDFRVMVRVSPDFAAVVFLAAFMHLLMSPLETLETWRGVTAIMVVAATAFILIVCLCRWWLEEIPSNRPDSTPFKPGTWTLCWAWCWFFIAIMVFTAVVRPWVSKTNDIAEGTKIWATASWCLLAGMGALTARILPRIAGLCRYSAESMVILLSGMQPGRDEAKHNLATMVVRMWVVIAITIAIVGIPLIAMEQVTVIPPIAIVAGSIAGALATWVGGWLTGLLKTKQSIVQIHTHFQPAGSAYSTFPISEV